MNKFKKIGLAVSALIATSFANAQTASSVLPADLTSTMDGVKLDITTVGGILIGLAALALALRWVKATFF